MPVTRVSDNEWLVEVVDPLTRQTGDHHLMAQFMVSMGETGILVCPWRLVRHHDQQGLVAYPLPCSQHVLDAYWSMVLVEMLRPAVQLWTSREQTDSDMASVDEITEFLLGGS